MDWSHVIAFVAIATVVVVSPGANFALILKTVPVGGSRAAFATIAGFAGALLLHGSLSIFGFSMIFASSESLLMGVKILGAAYLFYLGIQSIKDARLCLFCPTRAFTLTTVDIELVGSAQQTEYSDQHSLWRSCREGFITKLLNPKTSLFYLAAVPSLLTNGTHLISFSLLLVMTHIFIDVLWFAIVAITIERLVKSASSDKFVKLLKLMSGIALIGFGTTFAVSASAHIS